MILNKNALNNLLSQHLRKKVGCTLFSFLFKYLHFVRVKITLFLCLFLSLYIHGMPFVRGLLLLHLSGVRYTLKAMLKRHYYGLSNILESAL